MEFSWRTSEAVEWGFQVPERAVFFFNDGEKRHSIGLRQVEAHKVGDFVRSELRHHDWILSLKMESENMQLSFLFLINPAKKVIYIPPWGLVNNRKYPWVWSKMQQIFEQVATRNDYKLMVCVAANEAGVFNSRLLDILNRNEGYHMAPPQKKWPHAKQFWIHRTTYDNKGIPELWVSHDEMLLSE